MDMMAPERILGRWIDIGTLEDIPRRGARVVKTPQGCIAVFRTEADEVFALDDRCPHKGGPLSQGIVHDRAVTCPLHNWVIDLATGQARAPDAGRVATVPLRCEQGRLLLDVARLASRAA
jgi:nitrite reductase (NADH) small subunit